LEGFFSKKRLEYKECSKTLKQLVTQGVAEMGKKKDENVEQPVCFRARVVSVTPEEATAMLAGRLRGEKEVPIEKGSLLDGQHRLRALSSLGKVD
jgi:hypothetical protein